MEWVEKNLAGRYNDWPTQSDLSNDWSPTLSEIAWQCPWFWPSDVFIITWQDPSNASQIVLEQCNVSNGNHSGVYLLEREEHLLKEHTNTRTCKMPSTESVILESSWANSPRLLTPRWRAFRSVVRVSFEEGGGGVGVERADRELQQLDNSMSSLKHLVISINRWYELIHCNEWEKVQNYFIFKCSTFYSGKCLRNSNHL